MLKRLACFMVVWAAFFGYTITVYAVAFIDNAQIEKTNVEEPEVQVQCTAIESEEEITVTEMKPIHEIAQDCIVGVYGTGEERVNNLITLGYNPDEVQEEINKQMAQYSNNQTGKDTIVSYTISQDAQQIKEEVWCRLKEFGYSDIAVAGIMGNMAHESGLFNPKNVFGHIKDGKYYYYGLCMWHSYYHKAMFDMYGQFPSVQSQCEYLNLTFGYIDDSSIEAATRYFCNHYERPSIPVMNSRIKYAWSIYYEFHTEN